VRHTPPLVHQQVPTHARATHHLINTLTTHSSSHITPLQPHTTLTRQIHQLRTQSLHTHTTHPTIGTLALTHRNGPHEGG